MKAEYIKPSDCESCLDLGWFHDCITCEKWRTHQVDILVLGVGISGDKAVVEFPNGNLETVPINSIKILKDA